MSLYGTPPPDQPPEPAADRSARSLLLVAVAIVAALAVVVGYIWLQRSGDEGDPTPDYVVVVPAGTGLRMDAGEQPAIIPRQLDLAVGQRLVIRNEDDRAHLVGPFTVRAGEELGHRFDEPGTFVGECTLHPDGAITIRVT